VICSPALKASGRAARWVVAQQRQQQCDAEADLEQDLLPIQPAPARHSRAQLPRAPAGSCLQLHHNYPNKILAFGHNVLVDTVSAGGGLYKIQFFKFKMKICSLRKLTIGATAALAAISLSPASAQAACAPGTPAGTCRVTVN
jgi:hypothetical protein